MTSRRLRIYAYLGLLLYVGLLHTARTALLALGAGGLRLVLLDLLIVLGAVVFFSVLFGYLRRTEEQLVRRNRELLTLHAAAQDVHRVLDLDVLLQRVVDEARDLLGARYGALSVVGADGAIESFHVSGLSAAEISRIGPPPTGKGLLGVVLREGQILRLPALGSDPRSSGFPANHPPMGALLAVPVECRGPFRGNLYLADRDAGGGFSEGDAETLQRFATQVAIAIDNQFLNRRLRELAVAEERARIARELHDGTAQVLAYVNTKAQAVREYLVAGRSDEAAKQLEQLAAAARNISAEVREGIVALRTSAEKGKSLGDGIRSLVDGWSEDAGVEVELRLDATLTFEPEVEIQLLRITGEALANARRHARARRVELALERFEDGVRLSIVDDGVGFELGAPPPDERQRFGLLTMSERAAAIGGRLDVRSKPGGPTAVAVELPERSNGRSRPIDVERNRARADE